MNKARTEESEKLALRRRLALVPLHMLGEARHDLDEVARHVPVVELAFEDMVPAVAAGAGRPRQAEVLFALGHTCGSARLYCRGADLLEGDHVEGHAKALDLLLEQRAHRLDRHIASGEPGAACG